MSTKKIPQRINKISSIVENLWWSWHHRGRELFRTLDHYLWKVTNHNPIEMINKVPSNKLEQAVNDPSFLKIYDEVMKNYQENADFSSKWFTKQFDTNKENPVAYFSFEFGLHQSLPIYSGGLGILAGDTVKEANDLGIPFVGIGFYYHQGYFKQHIPPHGWQEAEFNKLDPDKLPIYPLEVDGRQLIISVKIGLYDEVKFRVWKVKVGNVHLYLLDTDIEENPPWYRGLSSRLYGGDKEMRLNQEYVLGIGGVKLLEELNISPSVWHLNEGHCSFLSIERIINFVKSGLTFEDALEKVRETTVFTTHTPVPAGHDQFDLDMVLSKFQNKITNTKITKNNLTNLGLNKKSDKASFNMTILGINTSGLVNGVSQLHTKTTRDMWKNYFNENNDNNQLLAITNGVHLPTWISGPMRRLFSKFIDDNWIGKQDKQTIWNKIQDIPDHQFWNAHMQNKRRLMEYIRETSRAFRIEGKMDAEQILASGTFFDPDALTIGFARRFATYKRADLIFKDIKRLRRILNDPYKPVQILFAGKAHPADDKGKHILQQVYQQALDENNGGRIAFIENYDMHVGRFMVQGVDLWLNTPIRPYEASGTSGIKAAVNGVPHFSTLDGWWAEGFNGSNGWVIGGGEVFSDREKQDIHDVTSLYSTLESEIVPLYYDGDADGIPRKWINISKEAIRTSAARFSSSRMLKEYTKSMYFPTSRNS